MKQPSAENGEKFSHYREMMSDLLDDLRVTEAVSLITMVMAEYMIKMTSSDDQYHQAVDKASGLLHALPNIIRVMMDEEDSVKH
jgi:hypothetical protein